MLRWAIAEGIKPLPDKTGYIIPEILWAVLRICPRESIYEGRAICAKLKEKCLRTGSKCHSGRIQRENNRRVSIRQRKDVYRDIFMRIDAQNEIIGEAEEGKKKMKERGRVNLPQEVFLRCSKNSRSQIRSSPYPFFISGHVRPTGSVLPRSRSSLARRTKGCPRKTANFTTVRHRRLEHWNCSRQTSSLSIPFASQIRLAINGEPITYVWLSLLPSCSAKWSEGQVTRKRRSTERSLSVLSFDERRIDAKISDIISKS